jgi:hypothetical protein
MLKDGGKMNKIILSMILCLAGTIAMAQTVTTDSTSKNTVNTDAKTKTIVLSPPPSAVQTQIIGISAGTTIVDENCEQLKIAKTLYDMGMKVAAVSVLCQDRRVFDAMAMAGTPCPFKGKLGDEAKEAWKKNIKFRPKPVERIDAADVTDNATKVGAGLIGLALLFLIK